MCSLCYIETRCNKLYGYDNFFPINQLKWSIPVYLLRGSPISPQDCRSYIIPIFPVCTTYLFQSSFQNFIECLHCRISFWMVGTTLMVLYKEFYCQHCDYVADKVTTLIIGQTSRTSKPSDNVLEDKFGSCICRRVLKFLYFIPSCEVISCGSDVSGL
jgi:hypothetical protein